MGNEQSQAQGFGQEQEQSTDKRRETDDEEILGEARTETKGTHARR